MNNDHVDTTPHINTVEWFFGYGGNHLGLRRTIRNLRLIAACEIEAYALANMAAKMEAGLLDPAPIWTDCKTFPYEPFQNRIGLFIASYPCQGFSAAGKRLGLADPRYLWPWVRRFYQRTRPEYCFFENVAGHVSLGLSTVLSDLEEDGYTTASGIFSALEVGSTQVRKRIFILAKLEHAHRAPGSPELRLQPQERGEIFGSAGDEAGADVADRDGERQRELQGLLASIGGRIGNSDTADGWTRVLLANECEPCDCCGEPRCPACDTHYADCTCPGPSQDDLYEYREIGGVLHARPLAVTSSAGREGREQRGTLPRNGGGTKAHGSTSELRRPRASVEILAGTDDRLAEFDARQRSVRSVKTGPGSYHEPTGPGHGLPAYPPGPCDLDAWRAVLEIAPALEPAVCGVVDGHPNRVDRLRLCGNGVVPDCAETAFRTLYAELQAMTTPQVS